jgi:DNA-binding NarL/FixJ family response regulator
MTYPANDHEKKPATIILADDHQVVRQGLRALLEATGRFVIVGETGNGLEVARLVEHLQPNVLVLDMMMPGLNGLGATRHVKSRAPSTHVIILSMHKDESYVIEALKNGASAYVLKDANAEDLVKAIDEAMGGRRYLSPPLSEAAISAYLEKAAAGIDDAYRSLSGREREVLQLAAEGYTNPEIGKRLFISPRTVEIHRANMMRKLALHNQTELIRYAMKKGLIADE